MIITTLSERSQSAGRLETGRAARCGSRAYKMTFAGDLADPLGDSLRQFEIYTTMPKLLSRRAARAPINPKQLHLAWIIPDFHPGDGGHTNIFRIIHHLEQFGHKSELWIQNPSVHLSAAGAKSDICRHFFPIRAAVHLLDSPNQLSQICADGVIATDRWTAFPAQE